MTTASPDTEEGQSFLGYLREVQEAAPPKKPSKPKAKKPKAPAPIVEYPTLGEDSAPPPMVETGPCQYLTRKGAPCERPADIRTKACPSHAHLVREAALLPLKDVDVEIEARRVRDAKGNPPSLHLLLKRVADVVNAMKGGSRWAVRDALLDVAAVARNAAEGMPEVEEDDL